MLRLAGPSRAQDSPAYNIYPIYPRSRTQTYSMRILLLALLPIGDTLFTTPGIRALKAQYPDAHVTALVYPTNKGILEDNPDIDDFLLWPTRQNWPGFTGVARLFWALRRGHYDLAVEFCSYIWW